MFEKLKQFIRGQAPPIEDRDLGTLSWSSDIEAWVTVPQHRGLGFVFEIAGTPRPDAELRKRVAQIAAKKEEFSRAVQRVLAEESASARHLKAYKDEIAGLKIESVCLRWPHRPANGMIYFAEGRNYRLWRCDYVDGVPKALGFDS